MDNVNNIGSIAGIVSLISGLLYGIFQIINHSHCKSACCGAVSSLDVDIGDNYKNLPPPTEKPTRQSQLNETKNEP